MRVKIKFSYLRSVEQRTLGEEELVWLCGTCWCSEVPPLNSMLEHLATGFVPQGHQGQFSQAWAINHELCGLLFLFVFHTMTLLKKLIESFTNNFVYYTVQKMFNKTSPYIAGLEISLISFITLIISKLLSLVNINI